MAIKKRIKDLKIETEAFNKLLRLNPNPGIPYTNYKEKDLIKYRKYKYCLYSWITGESSDKYVSISELKKYFKTYFSSDDQIYYDIVCLGLISIEQRPKCPICNKKLWYDCLTHGYQATCSKECHSEFKKIHMNSSMIKKGDKQSEETKKKISNALKGCTFSDEWKKKHSDHMKEFAKTEKGKEFYKKVGEIVSKKNIERLKGENIKEGRYLTNKNFKRGVYESDFLGRTFNYDSSWELKFIQYFEDDSIKEVVKIIDRCKDSIVYFWDDGSKHRYLPDFFIEFNSGIRIVIEIKPSYLLKTNRKVQLCIQAGKEYFESKGIKFYVLTEKELLSGNKIKDSFDIKDYDK